MQATPGECYLYFTTKKQDSASWEIHIICDVSNNKAS